MKPMKTIISIRPQLLVWIMSRCLFLVTGASRGFGRCVAEEFVRSCASTYPLEVILIARNKQGLQETASALRRVKERVDQSKDFKIREESLDLGNLEQVEQTLETLLSSLDAKSYSRAILVNNAGSLGDLCFVQEFPSLSALRREIDMNLTCAMWITSRFVSIFGARRSDDVGATSEGGALVGDVEADGTGDAGTSTGSSTTHDATCEPEGSHSVDRSQGGKRVDLSSLVINVSSLAAVKPYESWGVYCAGKSAREMFHSVLAKEQETLGGVQVLNYSPGPMDTDMLHQICSSSGCFLPYRQSFQDSLKQGSLVDPSESAKKCVRVALTGRFQSGARVDFYDPDP
ncbi:unnamed protein product [Choristocarpus tenellus]